jgi:phage shock protein A
MLGNFFPPVIFQVEAIAGEAIATFGTINKQLKAMEAQALKTGKALTTMNKAAIAGTKVLKGLGIAFAAFAAIGVKEIMDLEKSFTRLGQAMASVGVSTDKNRREVAALVDSYEDLGFGSEKAADAYATLITATGNVERSNKLLAISADLARYKQMSLDEAARVLAKATQGSTRAFKELGISLDTGKAKSVAIEEAIDKLAQRVGGQATAYSKTFAGQLAILNENLGDLAEQIGMRILPFLNKLISGLNNSGEWIKKNQELVMAMAAAITILLIPAVVNLTKKLAALALTLLKSPIVRIAAVIMAVTYAMIKLYNQTDKNRKIFAAFAQAVVDSTKFMVDALENVWWIVAEALPLAFANFLKWVGKYVPWAKTWGQDLEKSIKTTTVHKFFENTKKELLDMSVALEKIKQSGGKPIKLEFDFKIPEIPGFENGEGLGDTLADEIDKGYHYFF